MPGLQNQLRRIPPPIALAVGILFGFLFARLLPWTSVSGTFFIANYVWHRQRILAMCWTWFEYEHCVLSFCLCRHRRPCGEVGTFLQKRASTVDSLSNYRHWTSERASWIF